MWNLARSFVKTVVFLCFAALVATVAATWPLHAIGVIIFGIVWSGTHQRQAERDERKARQ